MESLKDKVVVITGASSGIGACIARYMAQYKPKLVLVARSPDKLKTVQEDCEGKGCGQGNVMTVLADMGKTEDVDKIIPEAVNKFGTIDVLVNNAAAFAFNDVEHTSGDVYDRTMAVNLRAPFFLSQAAIPHLKKTQGSIVNISSTAARTAVAATAVYSMSKAALEHFTRLLALELASSNVRVNAVTVGVTKTDSQEAIMKAVGMPVDMGKAMEEKMLKTQPLGGSCSMEDVAKVVTFLASDLAGAVTGTCVPVERGALIAPVAEMPPAMLNVGDINAQSYQDRLKAFSAMKKS